MERKYIVEKIYLYVDYYLKQIVEEMFFMKLKKMLCIFCFSLFSLVTFGTSNVLGDETSDSTPRMSVSEFINSDLEEAIITDFDIPEYDLRANFKRSKRSYALNPEFGGSVGTWVYKYTVEPYALYQNSVTKEWKMVQVTDYVTHTTNTIVNGWMNSMVGWHGNLTFKPKP